LDRAEFADSFDALQMQAFQRCVIPFHDSLENIKEYMLFWRKEKTVKQHLDTVNKFAYGVIKERREKDLMLHSNNKEKDEDNVGGDLLHCFMTSKNAYGNLLTDEELRDTILNFIIAGRDTTAQALSWTFYNLMLYPAIQDKVYEEVCQYITNDIELDPPKLYEVVQNMIYSHAV
jgi:cytochrome P450